MPDQVTELYRHYDSQGQLLYVGISINAFARWVSHKYNGAAWAPLSVRVDIERYPSREAALDAEHKAIIAESPIYNLNQGCRPKETRRVRRPPYRIPKDAPRIPTLRAYDRVITRVEEIYKEKHGTSRGAKAWLGKSLGVSRQTIDNWGDRIGIPAEHVKDVAMLTGFPMQDVRPKTIIVEMSLSAWKAICEAMPEVASDTLVLPRRRTS